jgi:hypothetical protein
MSWTGHFTVHECSLSGHSNPDNDPVTVAAWFARSVHHLSAFPCVLRHNRAL